MNNSKVGIVVFALVMVFVAIGAYLFTTNNNKESEVTKKPKETEVENFSVSTTNLVIPKGETAEFSVSLKNAVGRIDIESGDVNTATVSDDKIWLESLDSGSEDKKVITVTGVETGTTHVVVQIKDVAKFDTEEELTGSVVIDVTVE